MKLSPYIVMLSLIACGLASVTHAAEGDFKSRCIRDLGKEPARPGDFDRVSIGPSVAAQVVRYDFASKRAAVNTGIGAGFSVRYYGKTKVGNEEYAIKQIKEECRATTAEAAFPTADTSVKVSSLFSISPFVYASKIENSDDLSVQPAIQVGFLGDLVNIGTGFNLTGPNKGHVFLLFSLGYGFKF